VNLLILVVDDEPDVEVLFRQQFRHDLRAGRFTVEFARSGDMALERIAVAQLVHWQQSAMNVGAVCCIAMSQFGTSRHSLRCKKFGRY
jgi:CheY-like chemotaxis protein